MNVIYAISLSCECGQPLDQPELARTEDNFVYLVFHCPDCGQVNIELSKAIARLYHAPLAPESKRIH